MKAARSVLTTERRLGAGAPLRAGSRAAYRAVVELEGEAHVVRSELVGDRAPAEVTARGPAIACLAHLTDVHVTDAESPARFEFVNREWDDPRFRELLTMQRPQETLNPHAIAAMVRTLNDVESAPLTGAPVGLTAFTGDAIDNTQRNELDVFLALMNGGTVQPDSGSRGYQGVQQSDWPGNIHWKPDGMPGGDVFTTELGYPQMPGLLERAMEAFESPGLRVPWLGCYGNHEQVCQGVGIVTPALASAMAGARKPIALPDGLDRDRALDIFVERPEFFMSGRSLEVAPDPRRRPISRAEYMAGQGRSDPYYVHDTGAVRLIALDTVCDAGGADGTIDWAQLRWLEERLEEAADRYVVVMSHHGHDTLSNPRGEQHAGELLEVLLSHRNAVLWLNGHIHANRITPRTDASGRGLWEVTTSSLVDWPCQARLVELFDAGSGLLGIACTMVDHDGAGLAGVHRELAANVPFSDFDSWRPGGPGDRNAILLLPAPF